MTASVWYTPRQQKTHYFDKSLLLKKSFHKIISGGLKIDRRSHPVVFLGKYAANLQNTHPEKRFQ